MFWIRRLAVLAGVAFLAAGASDPVLGTEAPAGGADQILESLDVPALRALALEVLTRNPEIAVLEARARAAAQRAPRAGALPDPMATLTAFPLAPETRTGPQRVSAGFTQSLPWFGKLALSEQAAARDAAAIEALVEARRLELVTETRRLYDELLFLDRRRVIGEELRDHLGQHEEIARSRYSTGAGHGQGVIKLQAEITLAEKELLDVQRQRIVLEARLNGLRDRPALTPVVIEPMPEIGRGIEPVPLDLAALTETALRLRPELAAAGARVESAQARVELAAKSRRPDFSVGLTFTVVDPRDDRAGRLQPPEGNGDDILGIQGGIKLPVWRKSLSAALQEALEEKTAAEETRRARSVAITAAVSERAQGVELDWRRLRLIEDLLIVQAEEAEDAALAGYIAGNLNALELLDAEHVRFEAHLALARARADYLIRIAELEGAVGAPLAAGPTHTGSP